MAGQTDLEFRAFKKGALERLELAQQVQKDIAKVRVRVQSRGREVGVVANGAGVVTELTLTQDAVDLGPQRLASEIMQTIDKARSQVATEVKGIVSVLGDREAADVESVVGGEMPQRSVDAVDAELGLLRAQLGIRNGGTQ